ncbi:hypothetical protein K0817_011140 [Microbacterium sp. HD4P20]|uniref:hypothetical protein n=1 Tax=Microbacterium sp. HD4P20 TaxID=2864874 RepID=UPI0020A609AA|nr:hypothetical protein [Microbacterium sp. HD4P20]MCP2637112.1 hypothetical protein [Microbacterium sp. HD4P20]
MTEDQREPNNDAATAEEAPQYGLGPFSIREVALMGTWLVAFVVSFFPIYGEVGRGPSVWSNGIDWVLTIGVPTAAVFLIVLRRLSPEGIRRVGSLGIDQFASVAFSVSTVLWLTTIWNSFITLANQRFFPGTWVVWVEFFLMLAGVFLTVLAPFIAPFAQDFSGRPETVAHRAARPVRPVSPRPVTAPAERAPQGAYGDDEAPAPPAAPAPYPSAADDAADSGTARDVAPAETAPDADSTAASGPPASETTETTVIEAEEWEPTSAGSDPAASAASTGQARHQAFWALVPEERDVVDEIGIPVFRIGPTAWALVIEDRGEVFVVRHEDGRIGYLHDVSGVTRG